ncbi:major pollen allergen Ole [Salix suchowensis]|nr:major pollen allergen Ole [Salix suchowensis]
MELAKYPLAYALLICLAVSAGSRSYGYGGGQYQIRGDDVQGRWCIAKPSAYNFELLRNLDYSCGQNGVECRQIQPGGSCFRPDTAFGHASYAMNLFFKAAESTPFGACTYPL